MLHVLRHRRPLGSAKVHQRTSWQARATRHLARGGNRPGHFISDGLANHFWQASGDMQAAARRSVDPKPTAKPMRPLPHRMQPKMPWMGLTGTKPDAIVLDLQRQTFQIFAQAQLASPHLCMIGNKRDAKPQHHVQ